MHLEILSCKYRFFSLLRVLISFKTLLTVVFWCFSCVCSASKSRKCDFSFNRLLCTKEATWRKASLEKPTNTSSKSSPKKCQSKLVDFRSQKRPLNSQLRPRIAAIFRETEKRAPFSLSNLGRVTKLPPTGGGKTRESCSQHFLIPTPTDVRYVLSWQKNPSKSVTNNPLFL